MMSEECPLSTAESDVNLLGDWAIEICYGTGAEAVGTTAFKIDTFRTKNAIDGSLDCLSKQTGVIAHFWFGGRRAETPISVSEKDIYALDIVIWRKSKRSPSYTPIFSLGLSNAMYTPGLYDNEHHERFLHARTPDNELQIHCTFDIRQYTSGMKIFLLRGISIMATHEKIEHMMDASLEKFNRGAWETYRVLGTTMA